MIELELQVLGLHLLLYLLARNINTFGYNYISGIATIGVTGGHYIGVGRIKVEVYL